MTHIPTKKIIFLGGSRKCRDIPPKVKERLLNILKQGHDIIVGDAKGADVAFQDWIARKNDEPHEQIYGEVTVYHVDDKPRYHKNNWKTKKIINNSSTKDFSFFATKDRAMAEKADYALMLWDGESPGTVLNIYRLLIRDKAVVVWDSNRGDFHTLKRKEDWGEFYLEIKDRDYRPPRSAKTLKLGPKIDAEIKNETPQQDTMF